MDQYSKLWDYCAEIRRTNPATPILLKVVQDEERGNQGLSRASFCRLLVLMGITALTQLHMQW